MPPLYPLRFEPLWRRYLWGGRRLQSVLGKPLPPGEDYAESWEVVDHGDDQSRVAWGPLAGTTLRHLVAQRGAELLGVHQPQPRFPLLFKFLDANQTLSVQVHPCDRAAARMDPPDLGKTEAWVIVHVEPGSVLYAGLQAGIDRQALEHAIEEGRIADCLHSVEPRAGDCLFVPCGLVHALGAGLVVAEIQQASDTTFRLFDWNRIGADGRPRPLHIRQALDVIDFDRGPAMPQTPQPTNRPHVERLVACDKFILDRWWATGPQLVGGDSRCHLLATLDGAVTVAGDADPRPLSRGQTALIPACLGEVLLSPRDAVTLLDIYLPTPEASDQTT